MADHGSGPAAEAGYPAAGATPHDEAAAPPLADAAAAGAAADAGENVSPSPADGPAPDAAAEVKLCLCYLPYAGRGELTRLIAAVGGLELDDVTTVEDIESYSSSGSLPVLSHGELKISQSFAIESYISSIAPAYEGLDPSQRAIDYMFCKIKEDALQDFSQALVDIASDEAKKASAVEDITAIADKWFGILEARLPELGFVNGREIPTPADLAVLNMASACVPFETAHKMAGYDLVAKFPRFAAHAARVAEHESVKSYLDKSPTWLADESTASKDGKEQAQKISKLAEETAAFWHAVDSPTPDCAVVWLHGLAETEVYWQELFELYNIMDLSAELGELRWIMPRAQPQPCTARGGAQTLQWFDTPDYPVCHIVPGVPDAPRQDEDPQDIFKAVHIVHEAVLALEVEGVPHEKIVIAGFGQGGALAIHAALSYPKSLSGCAMLCGYVPCLESGLKAAATPAGLHTEMLWLHGIHDAVVHIDSATAQAKSLSEMGVRLDFRLGLDYGHETTDETLAHFRAWLIKKLKPPSEEEENAEEEQEGQVETQPEPLEQQPPEMKQDPWGAPQRVSVPGSKPRVSLEARPAEGPVHH